MEIRTRLQQGIQILELEGEVDFHSSPKLRQKLLEIFKNPSPKILADFKQVTYIDSSGLATFVETLQKVRKVQGQLVLIHLSAPVRSVFEIAKLDTVFQIAASEEEALQRFSLPV